MTGELAQLIAITSHGNAFLSSGLIADDFFPSNSSFNFCSSVRFFDHDEMQVADHPVMWLQALQIEGCKKLRLYHARNTQVPFGPERKLAGFVGGGGIWLIECLFDSHSMFVNKHWEVTHQHAPDKRIWSVQYHRMPELMPTENQQYKVDEMRLQLGGVLKDISAFATNSDLQHWASWFDKAYSILYHLEPETQYYHRDLLVTANYTLEARQLLLAAGQAWVFGGMGSWNDELPADQKTYERLSEALYDGINRSVVAVVNSF